jgi:uncharacterized protein (TIGR00159 family)
MHHLRILADLRFQDVLDILFLTVVVYHLYLWFWGTKAFKALVGLLVIGFFFIAARTWGLFLTTWVFQIFWQVLVLMLIILFQSEIRQVLERFNPFKRIGLRGLFKLGNWIEEFVASIYLIAERRVGALAIIERADRVEEWVTGGTVLEAEIKRELLISFLQKESPMHDGAVLIKSGRIVQVACYLPLSSREGLPQQWGTRHRAALGLSERCDALVVVVSEERGEVSLARDGEMLHPQSPDELSGILLESMATPRAQGMTLRNRIGSLLLNRWQTKLGSLVLVSFVWLMLAGQQDFQVTLRVPLEIKNLPEKMSIVEPAEPTVVLAFRGLRKDASLLNERNIQVALDLSLASLGRRTFRITRDQISLPSDRVQLVRIDPSQIQFKISEGP